MPATCPRVLVLSGVRTLLRHRIRTALMLVSTALGVAAMIGTFAVNDQVFGAFEAVRRHLGAGAPLTVEPGANGILAAAVKELGKVEGVADAVPMVTVDVPLAPWLIVNAAGASDNA